MKVERASAAHVEQWAQLRAALWPGHPVEYHRDEASRTLLSGDEQVAAFVCQSSLGEVIGFAEAALRRDCVNGCKTSPVLFLEGIYVQPEHRRRGVARLLCDAVANWGISKGCSEFAADALLDNMDSHKFHAALGFKETERVVYFVRIL